jgi:CRP/FNR family cyclic AMP-dependent transcriptional regulator
MSRRAGQSGKEPSEAQVRWLDADPNSARWLSDVRRAEAEPVLVATTQRLSVGAWELERTAPGVGGHLGLLVLEGASLCERTVADHDSAALLGPSDLIRQWPLADGTRLLPVDAHWSVLSPTMQAVLNQRMAAELTSSPNIIGSPRDARLGSALVRRRRA